MSVDMSGQGEDDEWGDSGREAEDEGIEELPAGSGLVPYGRVNLTALDMAVHTDVSRAISERVDTAEMLAQIGTTEEELDREVDMVLESRKNDEPFDVYDQRHAGLPTQQPHEIVLEEEGIVRRGLAGEPGLLSE